MGVDLEGRNACISYHLAFFTVVASCPNLSTFKDGAKI